MVQINWFLGQIRHLEKQKGYIKTAAVNKNVLIMAQLNQQSYYFQSSPLCTKKRPKLNWKKIDENWKRFTQQNKLDSERDENNYFYGYQDIYKAKEHFDGFEIFYENKFNKSTNYGSSFKLGNALMICTPIRTNKEVRLTIKKNSLWRRLFGKHDKLKIIRGNAHINPDYSSKN